ncbi:MAG: sigma-70 family RNA polymerase sigma factor [bacterium]|nr:sigma-70 family RNA polymerase sigma factor [bacterium]
MIQAFQSRDGKAFDQLVLKYKNKVFNLCYQFLGHYEDAEDCAQESFIKVFHHLKDFRFQSSFSTWLYRIAVNTCKNKISSLEYRLRKRNIYLDKPKESDKGVFLQELPDDRSSPAVLLERKEMLSQIQQAIRSLSKKQRTLVILRDVEGLAYEEIVRITGFKLGTVKSKLARARDQLKEKLKGVQERNGEF